MIYHTNPRMIVANVLSHKQCYHEDTFNNTLKELEANGLEKFMLRRNKSITHLCNYFTKMTGSIQPITHIQLNM